MDTNETTQEVTEQPTEWYNTEQAAVILGVSQQTVRNMARDGRITKTKREYNTIYYDAAEIHAFKNKTAEQGPIKVRYMTVIGDSPEALDRQVNELYSDGFVVAGGLSMVVQEGKLIFAQAMVRESFTT